MINACLNWNCVIALEEECSSAPALRQIQEWSKKGKVVVCISSPSCLENHHSLDKSIIDENEWNEKLHNVGLEGIELHSARPRSFSDANGTQHWISGIEQIFMREVHARLFPTVDFLLRDYAQRRNIELPNPPQPENEEQRKLVRTWNNRKNDALSIYTFGTWSGPNDVFVTGDNKHLLKKSWSEHALHLSPPLGHWEHRLLGERPARHAAL